MTAEELTLARETVKALRQVAGSIGAIVAQVGKLMQIAESLLDRLEQLTEKAP